MKTEKLAIQNWATGKSREILDKIHESEVNIAICERKIDALQYEVEALMKEQIEVRAQGDIHSIIDTLRNQLSLDTYPLLTQDIKEQLLLFQKVANVEDFKLLLVATGSNMCRKFHTDFNDLRLLCTYSGPGTLWLKDEDIHHLGLDYATINEAVVEEPYVQQVPTGSITILKGAIYPDVVHGVIHRSPTIEESGEYRLLLRIDTLSTQNLWQ